jgi:hypothetical protein
MDAGSNSSIACFLYLKNHFIIHYHLKVPHRNPRSNVINPWHYRCPIPISLAFSNPYAPNQAEVEVIEAETFTVS